MLFGLGSLVEGAKVVDLAVSFPEKRLDDAEWRGLLMYGEFFPD